MVIRQLQLEAAGQFSLKNKKDYKKAKLISNIGKSNYGHKIIFETLGYNYKMNNIQAALGIAQIKKLNYILKLKKLMKITKKKYQNI